MLSVYTRIHAVQALPDPGSGTQPPGTGDISTIIAWAAWLAFAVCVLGVILCGAKMALDNQRGRGGGGGEHAASLGWVFAGCIVIGAASALVGALV